MQSHRQLRKRRRTVEKLHAEERAGTDGTIGTSITCDSIIMPISDWGADDTLAQYES